MLRYLAVSSAAVLCLLTAAAAPAEAGQSTGTWKYWSPQMARPAPYWSHGGGYRGHGYGHAQPAPSHWHQGGGHGGGGYGHFGRGYGGYPQPPYGWGYGYRRAPGW